MPEKKLLLFAFDIWIVHYTLITIHFTPFLFLTF